MNFSKWEGHIASYITKVKWPKNKFTKTSKYSLKGLLASCWYLKLVEDFLDQMAWLSKKMFPIILWMLFCINFMRWSWFGHILKKIPKKIHFMSYNCINVFLGGYIELNEINANSTRNSQVASTSRVNLVGNNLSRSFKTIVV